MDGRAKVTIRSNILAHFVIIIVELKLVVCVGVVEDGLFVSRLDFFQTKGVTLANAFYIIQSAGQLFGGIVKVSTACVGNCCTLFFGRSGSFVLLPTSNFTN